MRTGRLRVGRLGLLAALVALASWLVGGALASVPAPHFESPQSVPEDGSNEPAGVVLADMNRDGRTDLVTVNDGSEVTIRDGGPGGSFGPPQVIPVGAGHDYYGLAVARINGDRRPDIVTTNYNDDAVSVLLAHGGGTFSSRTFSPDPGSGGAPTDVAVADFNGDGLQDLAVTDGVSGSIWVLLGKGDGRFRDPLTATAHVSESLQIVTGRFDDDRRVDLAVVSSDTTADVLLGRKHGHFHALPAIDFGSSRSAYGIAAGHFNNDKLSDLAIAVEDFNTMPSPDYVAALTATGGGDFHERDIADGEHANLIGVGIGDFNGDGVPDIAAAGYDSGDVTVLAGKGGGRFAAAVSVGGVSNGVDLTPGHVDANRSMDLAVGSSTDVAILRNKRSR